MQKFKLYNLLSLIFAWIAVGGQLLYGIIAFCLEIRLGFGTMAIWALCGASAIIAAVFEILQIVVSKGVDPIAKKITNRQNKIIDIIFSTLNIIVGATIIVFGIVFIGEGETNEIAFVALVAVVLLAGLAIYQTLLFVWKKEKIQTPQQPVEAEQKVAQ